MPKVWGEVTTEIPEHRGKSGLLLLEILANHTFKAYNNTDYDYGFFQKGKWRMKGKYLTFTVFTIKNFGKGKQDIFPGKLLNKLTGTITYVIEKLSTSELILQATIDERANGHHFVLKPSAFNYFPE